MKLWDKLFGWTMEAELAGVQEYEAMSKQGKPRDKPQDRIEDLERSVG